MFIAEMTIKEGEAPPFSGQVGFKFDEHVNVFIGPNASGKTTLLQQVLDNYRREWAIASATETSKPEVDYINNQPVRLTSSEHCVFALEDNDADDHRNLLYDVIIVPAIRVRYGAAPHKDGPITDSEQHDFFGVEHLTDVFYQDYIHSTISALQRTIEGNPVEGDDMPEGRQFADWELLHPFVEAAAKEDPNRAAGELLRALSVGHSCAKDICDEIVVGDAPFGEPVVQHLASGNGLPSIQAHVELGLRIQTTDTQSGRRVPSLNINQLSAGTEGTLWWTRLIALSLLFMNQFNEGWQKRRAILLVDEIENHLHPTWQRRVIPALKHHFPGLQIFATTHSPFVVAGLKAGQVHRLYRDEKEIVRAEPPNDVDIMGWTMDEILRGFMGVQDPTDKDTAEAAATLRRLRDEGPRDTEDAEAARQARMQELRGLVDRDLLAGGPAAAQRELFEQQFSEALEKYRRSRDLGQDSG